MLVPTMFLDGDYLIKNKPRRVLPRFLAQRLPPLRAVHPVEPDFLAHAGVQDRDGVPVDRETNRTPRSRLPTICPRFSTFNTPGVPRP